MSNPLTSVRTEMDQGTFRALAIFPQEKAVECLLMARSVGSLRRNHTSEVGVKPTCQDSSTDGFDPSATLAGCSTTYALIRNPATSGVLSCLVPSLRGSQ